MGITSYFVLFFLAKKQSTNIDLHYPRTKNTIPLAKLKAIYAALSLACVLICINGMGHFAVTSPQHPIRPRLQNTFHPDETSKPLKENAIVTMYSTISESENSYNVQFADTLILAYSLLQSPETRIKPNENVEFIVAVVGDLSNAKRTSLLNLGARLLYLPELPSPNATHKACFSCYSKLKLFGMEGVFRNILYLDGNMFVLQPVTPIFQYAQRYGSYFAAAQSLGLSESTFDSSVMLFKPTHSLYDALQTLYEEPTLHDDYYAEQGLLNIHFNTRNTILQRWKPLPLRYNVQHPHLRDSKHLNNAILVQHNFWTENCNHVPCQPTFQAWRDIVTELYHHQVENIGRSDVGFIPEKFNDLQTLVKTNMLASRIVIHSLLSESPRNRALNNIRIPRVKRNRDRYIENYSNLFHFFQDKSDLEMVVWQKAYDAEQLVGLYDWIWLLDAGDAMIMNADIDLRVLLGRLILEAGYTADIVIAKDLKTLNAGSFFLRSSKWTKEFILAWKRWMDIPRMNEQHAIVGMTEKNELEINKHILVVPQSRQNLFNSYCFGKEPTFKKGDFVLHAPSKGYNYMIECMDKFNVTEVGFES